MCVDTVFWPVANLDADWPGATAPTYVLLHLDGVPGGTRAAIIADLSEALERLGSWEMARAAVAPGPPAATASSPGHGQSEGACQIVLRPRRRASAGAAGGPWPDR